MKKWLPLWILCMFLLGMTVSYGNGLSGQNLPSQVLMQETNPKTLLYKGGQMGLQAQLLQDGALKANIYSLIFKDKNEYSYGLAGDVQLGRTLLQSMTTATLPLNIFDVPKGLENLYLQLILSTLLSYVGAHSDSFQFVDSQYRPISPEAIVDQVARQRKAKEYVGIVRYQIEKDHVFYQGYVHYRLYNDKYYGPSVRFVALSDEGKQRWWGAVSSLLTEKGF